MKKIIATGLICIILFISLAALVNNPTFSAIQNQNSTVHVNLTHQAQHFYTVDVFDTPNAQYLDTTGDDTITIAPNITKWSYFDTFDNFNDSGDIIDNNKWYNATAGHLYENTTHCIFNTTECADYYSYTSIGVNPIVSFDEVTVFYADSTSRSPYWLQVDNQANWLLRLEFIADLRVRYYVTSGAYSQSGVLAYIENASTHNYAIMNYNDTFAFYLDDYSAANITIANATMINPTPASNYIHLSIGNGAVNADDRMFINRIRNGTFYQNETGTLEQLHKTTGSYCSSLIDLGEANNYFIQSINYSYIDNGDSDLGFYVTSSADNITWGGFSPIPANYSIGADLVRYHIFSVNFTASTDKTQTPEFFWMQVYWSETILNEVPSFSDIAPANNSIVLGINVPINCSIYDADGDLLNISLYINDALTNAASNCENGSFFYYLFPGNYSTTYAFYFMLTDGENTTISDLYLFTTGDEPVVPPETTHAATLTDYLVLLFGLCLVLLIGAANIPKRK